MQINQDDGTILFMILYFFNYLVISLLIKKI